MVDAVQERLGTADRQLLPVRWESCAIFDLGLRNHCARTVGKERCLRSNGLLGPTDSIHGNHALTVGTRRLLSWRAGWEKDSTVASHEDSPPPPLRDVSRCVVLSRGDDVSPGFLASLLQRGIQPVVIGRPLLAFAELLVAERARVPSGGWGLPERNRTAFIVADRDRWERLDQLLNAIRLRLPQVAVWVASSNLLMEVSDPPARPSDDDPFPDLPRLRLAGDVEGPGEHGAVAAPTPSVEPSVARPPLDRPARADEADPDPAPATEQETDSPRSRSGPPNSSAVTPEEIEMLLRMLPPEPPPGGSP